MISVIICSKDQLLSKNLYDNIAKTIAVEFEVIIADNSQKGEGICSVYNREAKKAKYPILCFIHEDILFKTNDWGVKLLNHFNDPLVGVIGVAGGDSYSNIPSTWSNSVLNNYVNIIQHQTNDNDIEHICIGGVHLESKRNRVIGVDGVLLCVKKTVFEEYPFDEKLLTGFHGYDVDFSLGLVGRYHNYVVYDILIEHFSTGHMNIAWLESCFAVASKWRHRLPVSVFDVTKKQWEAHHWKTLHVLIVHMFRLNYNYITIYAICLKYAFSKYFSVRRYMSMNRLYFQKLFSNKRIENNIEPTSENQDWIKKIARI